MAESSEQQQQQLAIAFKGYLLEDNDGFNLYDHLVRVLTRVMEERPKDALDLFENMSREVKAATLPELNRPRLQDVSKPPPALQLAELQRTLFEEKVVPKGDADKDNEDLDIDDVMKEDQDEGECDVTDTPLPDLHEIFNCLALSGVSLGQQECQLVYLALRQLVQAQGLQRCRLWGKILGTQGNYYVAEVQCSEELVEGDGEGDGGQQDEAEQTQEREEDKAKDLEEKRLVNNPPVVPTEPIGTGANKYVYFVCQQPGMPWVKLPPVTPTQINFARQIRKFFTGRLDAPVVSFPPFPGCEANYLRAQIARISAGTQVSPLHFYKIFEDEDAEEDEVQKDFFPQLYLENSEFNGIPNRNRTKLSAWVHHTEHILQQGVCTWVNMAKRPIMDRVYGSKETGDEEDEEEQEEVEEMDEEEEEQLNEEEPEMGPGILTPLSEDAAMDGSPAWSVRLSSTRAPEHALTVLRSNRWPGAHAYTRKRTFENIYVGWGLKAVEEQYTVPLPPLPQEEYPVGPDVTEALDPLLSMELSVKAAKERREKRGLGDEEGDGEEKDKEGEEEEEEEEDDDDDDD